MSNIQSQSHVKTMNFAEVFNRFFTALQAIFPAWKNAFPTTQHLEAAKRQWLEALVENGIDSSERLNIGLKKARDEGGDFFPSPAKFVAWCKPTPQDFGLPTFENAYREVCDKCGYVGHVEWSHAAVYHAISQVGIYDFRQMTHDKALSAFKNAYKLTVEAVMRGEALPQLPKVIERKEPVKASAEVANKHLEAMKALVGKPIPKPNHSQVDYTDPLLANEGEAA